MKAIEIKTTGSVGIAPLGYNPTEKLFIRDYKHLKIGSDCPREKLNIKK